MRDILNNAFLVGTVNSQCGDHVDDSQTDVKTAINSSHFCTLD